MMDFNVYKNNLPFPKGSDFFETHTINLKSGATESIIVFDNLAFDKAKSEYRKEDNRLFSQFLEDVKVHLGIENNPKADLLLSMAMDHSDRDMKSILEWAENMMILIV